MSAVGKQPEKTKSGRGGPRPGSGRPKGRKSAKTLEIEAAARRYTNDALKALVHVAKKGESEAARVSAAEALLNRGWGKPRQAVEHSGPAGGPIELHEVTDDQLRERAAAIAKRLGPIAIHRNGNGNGKGHHRR